MNIGFEKQNRHTMKNFLFVSICANKLKDIKQIVSRTEESESLIQPPIPNTFNNKSAALKNVTNINIIESNIHPSSILS